MPTMPAKAGSSHALSAIVSVMLGSVLGSYIKTHSEMVKGFTNMVGAFLTGSLGVPIHEEIAGIIFVIAAISFIWGVVYHYAREREDGPGESRF